jgi:hypothetical protein
LFSLSEPHSYPSPADIGYGAALARPVIPVASDAALLRRLHLLRGPRRAEPPGAAAGWLFDGSAQQRRILMAAEMILQGIRNTLPN